VPTLNLTLIMRQSCGTDVVMFSKKRLNYLHRRAVKLIFSDTTLTTEISDQICDFISGMTDQFAENFWKKHCVKQ